MGNKSSTSVWDEVYKSSMKDAKKAQQVVIKQVNQQNGQNQDAVNDYVRKFEKEIEQKNRKLCAKIWDQYDEDKNGEMSMDELKKLLKDSLKASKEWTPRMIEEMMTEGIEVSCQMLNDKEVATMLKDRLKESFPMIRKNIEAEIDKYIQSSDVLAVDLYKKMDANGDGKVVKVEFLDNYNQAVAEIINPQQMIESIRENLLTLI